jgi:hypothetical protein
MRTVLDVVNGLLRTGQPTWSRSVVIHRQHINIDWCVQREVSLVGGFATCSKRESNSWSFFFFHPLPPP